MSSDSNLTSRGRQITILRAAFARLDPLPFGAAIGVVIAVALWLMTSALLIQDPTPGYETGSHLQLLSKFMPGYTVTWAGSIIGAIYGLLIGGLVGIVIATLWNLSHYLFVFFVAIRAIFDVSLD
jgi:hypothetical protein